MLTDPLAELITLLQPSARFSKFIEGAGMWQIHRPNMDNPFYCAVLEGQCCMTINGDTPLLLQAGDFILVPDKHDLVNTSRAMPIQGLETIPLEIGNGHFRIGQQHGPSEFRMRVGYCSFGSPDAALLVSLLPEVILVRDEPRLSTLVQMVGEESAMQRPARELVLERLLEILLIEALRCGATPTASGLVRGMADKRLSIALRELHAHPDHAWTVLKLANHAAMSRSAFFTHFHDIMGTTPMEYLLTWRMALAKRLLGSLTVEQVAERVGYGSASTFSTAFSRHVGMTPS